MQSVKRNDSVYKIYVQEQMFYCLESNFHKVTCGYPFIINRKNTEQFVSKVLDQSEL